MQLPDDESVRLITTGLLLVCTLLIVPFALKVLVPGKPFRGGLRMPLMLLPLLLTFSSPALSLAPLNTFFPIAAAYSALYTFLLKLAANALAFYLAGFLFILSSNAEKTSWIPAWFTSILLTAVYLFSLDTGLLQLFV